MKQLEKQLKQKIESSKAEYETLCSKWYQSELKLTKQYHDLKLVSIIFALFSQWLLVFLATWSLQFFPKDLLFNIYLIYLLVNILGISCFTKELDFFSYSSKNSSRIKKRFLIYMIWFIGLLIGFGFMFNQIHSRNFHQHGLWLGHNLLPTYLFMNCLITELKNRTIRLKPPYLLKEPDDELFLSTLNLSDILETKLPNLSFEMMALLEKSHFEWELTTEYCGTDDDYSYKTFFNNCLMQQQEQLPEEHQKFFELQLEMIIEKTIPFPKKIDDKEIKKQLEKRNQFDFYIHANHYLQWLEYFEKQTLAKELDETFSDFLSINWETQIKQFQFELKTEKKPTLRELLAFLNQEIEEN